jgi:(+)-pinoresinol hydroxylase
MRRAARLSAAVLAAAVLAAAGSATAAAADIDNGKAIYRLWCYDCHAATGGRFGMLPVGFSVLSKRYNGSLPGDLAERTDLAPEYIRTMVRNGLNVMPKTRKTEISDRQLDDLVAFLNRNIP